MIVLPKKRHNFADRPPVVNLQIAEPLVCELCYFTLPQSIEKEGTKGMMGEGALEAIRNLLGQPSKIVGRVINEIVSGKASTAAKNAISKFDTNPTKRRQHPGEKHVPLKIGKKFGFANFMGPGTNLVMRLRQNDPPRTIVDRISKGHDIRLALSKTISDIRNADNIMIQRLNKARRNKEDANWNIQIGLKGIQTKKLLENAGLMRRDLFLSPTRSKDTKLLQSNLNKLKQQGFGHGPLPGDLLARRIRAKLGRKRRRPNRKVRRVVRRSVRQTVMKGRGLAPGKAAKIIVRNLLPTLIKNIKKLGIKQKVALVPKVLADLQKKIASKLKRGGSILAILGTIATIASLIGVGIDVAKVVLPVVKKVFGVIKGKLKGGRLLKSLSLDIAKTLKKAIDAKLRGLSGRGVKEFVESLGKKFAKLFKTVVRGAKGVAARAKQEINIVKSGVRRAVPISKNVLNLIRKLAEK